MPRVVIHRDVCKGCGLCMHVCPKKILSRADTLNARGVYPSCAQNPDDCIGCMQCVHICPDVAIAIEDDEMTQPPEDARQ